MAARISDDWQQMYGHPIYFLETFIDPERFRGTCYRAANWVLMGRTTGRVGAGEKRSHFSRNRPEPVRPPERAPVGGEAVSTLQ
jgi:hypothetical protein